MSARRATLQVDWLLGRMVVDGVRFSHQAVSRLTAFSLAAGQPKVAYRLFKVGSSGLVGGWVGGWAVPAADCTWTWRLQDSSGNACTVPL